jgi:hypothetical protein
MKGRIDPRVGLDVVVRINITAPAGNRTPIVQTIASQLTD